MIGGRRVQWERGFLAFDENSSAGQNIVEGADWENTSAAGLERGCTLMGIRLSIGYEIIDAVDVGIPLEAMVYKAHDAVPLSTSVAAGFPVQDILDLFTLENLTYFASATDFVGAGSINRVIKARRKLDSNDRVNIVFDGLTGFDIVGVSVAYSALLAAP